jgi:(E)-4-hydroxy-3-methylbut-2-enyl-diphosphate synthase
VPTEQLVDQLFAEIDKYYAAGRHVVRDEERAAEARAWLAENEDETALTPERMAALEAAAAGREPVSVIAPVRKREPVRLDEDASPVAGRRFTRR